eukprot:scaffold228_cov312-Pinguiococcus_pyrenoidosus.AAC.70
MRLRLQTLNQGVHTPGSSNGRCAFVPPRQLADAAQIGARIASALRKRQVGRILPFVGRCPSALRLGVGVQVGRLLQGLRSARLPIVLNGRRVILVYLQLPRHVGKILAAVVREAFLRCP